jgi:hypothetical protein
MHHRSFQPVAEREKEIKGTLTSRAAQHGQAALAVQKCCQPVSLVAFLRADSNSCAVFAAATIEFIGEFNV